MSTTVEKIFEEFQALPPEEKRQFVEMIERETHGSEQSRRAALSRSIRGKYAHLGVSSETVAAQKAEEIALEDRHSAVRRSQQ